MVDPLGVTTRKTLCSIVSCIIPAFNSAYPGMMKFSEMLTGYGTDMLLDQSNQWESIYEYGEWDEYEERTDLSKHTTLLKSWQSLTCRLKGFLN